MKVCIIGCGPAGIQCALSIKNINPKADVSIFGKEKNIFIRCSAPYAIAGITKLNGCTKPDLMLTQQGIKVIRNEVINVDTKSKKVMTNKKTFNYDFLVFATGAKPFVPPINGAKSKNVFTLREYNDAKKIANSLRKAKNISIIGGGLISVELASLLCKRFNVTIAEMLNHLLYSSYDEDFCSEIENVLTQNGVKLLLNGKVEDIVDAENVKYLICNGKKIKSDVIIITVGVKPEVELAKNSGIKTEKFGIETNEKMQTNVKNVYAIGDCAQSFSMITKKSSPSYCVSKLPAPS